MEEGGIQVEEGGIQVEVLAQKGASQRQNSVGPKHRRSGACAVSFVRLASFRRASVTKSAGHC